MKYTCVPHIYHIQRLSMCNTSLISVYPTSIRYNISHKIILSPPPPPPPPPQECQAVRTELQRTVAEKESLSLKVQEYAQSLLRAEEAIAVKEREKSELVESYRALSEEADKLDSTVQLSLGEKSATKLELSTIAQVIRN